jgi:DNA repair exonuclease SbcCD ATPase subunit
MLRDNAVEDSDRFYNQRPRLTSFKTRAMEAAPAMATTSCGLALDLVYQVAEVIKEIEHRASATESDLKSLELAQRRIEELEIDLQSAQLGIGEARVKLKESEEAARTERLHLETAERRICELEMRVRIAESEANEHSTAVAQITEAIRTQILESRTPSKKLKLSV